MAEGRNIKHKQTNQEVMILLKANDNGGLSELRLQ